jgi:hypothetical protein
MPRLYLDVQMTTRGEKTAAQQPKRGSLTAASFVIALF